MSVEIISILTKKEDIQNIVEKIKNLSFEKIKKHPHFEFSAMEKLTDISRLSEIFKKFHLIRSIEIRENIKKEKYYSLNYEIEDRTYAVIVISLELEPIIINGFCVSRNYKNFEKSLRKNYGDKFV